MENVKIPEGGFSSGNNDLLSSLETAVVDTLFKGQIYLQTHHNKEDNNVELRKFPHDGL